jgi:NAD(P)-dependent dehydrogenase (short-subunit alcohol dehydrogenase family)
MSVRADPIEFAGKRVVVSGGTKGLGRATVERFLKGGARVITAARGNPEPIAGAEFVRADLTTAEGGEMLATAALAHMGGVDILAHVIGGSSSPGGGFAALTDDHWLAELNLNLLATVRLDPLLVPHMIVQGAGRVCWRPISRREGLAEAARQQCARVAVVRCGRCRSRKLPFVQD